MTNWLMECAIGRKACVLGANESPLDLAAEKSQIEMIEHLKKVFQSERNSCVDGDHTCHFEHVTCHVEYMPVVSMSFGNHDSPRKSRSGGKYDRVRKRR